MILPEQRRLAAKAFNVEVESIPIERVRTPLRQTIQLLKRHRDIRFTGNPDDKPISIIITTLAAMAYSNQTEVFEAIDHIVRSMRSFIKPLNGGWWIPNPVNPKENFADRWDEHRNGLIDSLNGSHNWRLILPTRSGRLAYISLLNR